MSTIGTGSIEQQQKKRQGTDPDSEYSAFLAHVKATFKKAVSEPDSRLFYVSFDPFYRAAYDTLKHKFCMKIELTND